MAVLKDIDIKILSELMRNSRLSDRQLAKKIRVSQPTVTRRRTRLEKQFIDGYTALPIWRKLGFEILAFTLVKSPPKIGSDESEKDAYKKSLEWLEKQPNVIFGAGCRGMGMSGIMLSIHKNYADLDRFLTNHRQKLGPILEDVQTIIVNLAGRAIHRPFHPKHITEAL